jgi:hypothetical protein
MFVIVVEMEGNRLRSVANCSSGAANAYWKRLVDEVVVLAAKSPFVATIRMYDVAESDPQAATEAAEAGNGRIVNTITISPFVSLRGKVRRTGPGLVDLDILQKADDEVAKYRDAYLELVQQDIRDLKAAIDALADGGGDDHTKLDKVYKIAYRMKGLGGTFGFPLVTSISGMLCEQLAQIESLEATDIEIIQLFTSALRLIVAQKMTKDGGLAGSHLLSKLSKIHEKKHREVAV